MNVIPVINCPDESCAREKFAVLKKFLPAGSFVHADITDGVWSTHATFSDPSEWARLALPFALEAHLMVERPEEIADDWFTAGARRIIVHLETVDGTGIYRLLELAARHQAELMLSIAPGTDTGSLEPLIARFDERLAAFQVLAVHPGAAGQRFGNEAIARIISLRGLAPHATIEVDGGMNPETVRLVKNAGADTIVSASYIFNSGDPERAYEELKEI